MQITNGDLKQILSSVLKGNFIVANIHTTSDTTPRAIDQLINGGYAKPFFGNVNIHQHVTVTPDVAKSSLASMIFTPASKGV